MKIIKINEEFDSQLNAFINKLKEAKRQTLYTDGYIYSVLRGSDKDK